MRDKDIKKIHSLQGHLEYPTNISLDYFDALTPFNLPTDQTDALSVFVA